MSEQIVQAGRREWIALSVLLLPALIVSMDNTVLFLAMPFISADLTPSGDQMLWILDSYGFVLAGLLITMGTLGDRIGRRKLLIIGALAFGAASLLASFASSSELLIAARVLMGVAGATLAPSTLSLISNMFTDPKQRTAAIGAWTAAFGGGAIIGPIVAGLLLEHFWWGSVFLINLPFMVALVVLAPLLLPEFKHQGAGSYDLISAALSLLTVLAVIFGIQHLAASGVSVESVGAIAAGLLVGVVFWLRQRGPDPLLDITLFRRRGFGAALSANTMALVAMVGSGYFAAQYLQVVLGLSPFAAALWSLPSVLGMVIASSLAPVLAQILRPGLVVAIGLLVSAAGFAVIAQAQTDSSPWIVVGGSAVVSLGLGLVLTLAADLILSAAPPERAGSAAGLSETGTELGNALGIAVLGSIGLAVYRSLVDAPDGVAADTLGGAAQAARSIGGEQGAALLRSAQSAFTDAMQFASWVAAAIVVVTAVVAFLRIRQDQR